MVVVVVVVLLLLLRMLHVLLHHVVNGIKHGIIKLLIIVIHPEGLGSPVCSNWIHEMNRFIHAAFKYHNL